MMFKLFRKQLLQKLYNSLPWVKRRRVLVVQHRLNGNCCKNCVYSTCYGGQNYVSSYMEPEYCSIGGVDASGSYHIIPKPDTYVCWKWYTHAE